MHRVAGTMLVAFGSIEFVAGLFYGFVLGANVVDFISLVVIVFGVGVYQQSMFAAKASVVVMLFYMMIGGGLCAAAFLEMRGEPIAYHKPPPLMVTYALFILLGSTVNVVLVLIWLARFRLASGPGRSADSLDDTCD